MTTESNAADLAAGGFTPDEIQFFETGGESGLNTEAGSDNTGGANEGDGSNTGTEKGGDQGKTGGEKAPQNVPLAALHEERTKRKALGETVKSLEAQIAEFKGKFSIIERLKGLPGGEQEQPAGPPAPEEDIFGNVKHVGETVEQLKKRLDDADKAAKDRETAEAADREFVGNYRNDAAAFEAKTPDYRAAYNHLLNSRAQELISIGYDDPNALAAGGAAPAVVHAARKALHDALIADERGIAELAFSKQKSPAEIIYGLARQRGYAPKAGDGKSKGAQTLENIERGQREHKSLNDTGGGNGEDAMTAERLIAMPLAEFEAWSEKHPAQARRLMGG